MTKRTKMRNLEVQSFGFVNSAFDCPFIAIAARFYPQIPWKFEHRNQIKSCSNPTFYPSFSSSPSSFFQHLPSTIPSHIYGQCRRISLSEMPRSPSILSFLSPSPATAATLRLSKRRSIDTGESYSSTLLGFLCLTSFGEDGEHLLMILAN